MILAVAGVAVGSRLLHTPQHEEVTACRIAAFATDLLHEPPPREGSRSFSRRCASSLVTLYVPEAQDPGQTRRRLAAFHLSLLCRFA